eukprot:Lithocolla_globosa_v1_NODE_407_length_4133_cov_91.104463.p7 type:complete len:105 gc:universal NODE_407_length_4133_cov_91.104463:29-343(+)
MAATLQRKGAVTIVSIFIALNTSKGAPATTLSPTLTLTSTTIPLIELPMEQGSEAIALGREASVFLLVRSWIVHTLAPPSTSQNTSLVPSPNNLPVAKRFRINL